MRRAVTPALIKAASASNRARICFGRARARIVPVNINPAAVSRLYRIVDLTRELSPPP